jgi:hypothetical protein
VAAAQDEEGEQEGAGEDEPAGLHSAVEVFFLPDETPSYRVDVVIAGLQTNGIPVYSRGFVRGVLRSYDMAG